jgi:hypothetical protein
VGIVGLKHSTDVNAAKNITALRLCKPSLKSGAVVPTTKAKCALFDMGPATWECFLHLPFLTLPAVHVWGFFVPTQLGEALVLQSKK